MTSEANEMVKVTFPLCPGWHHSQTETLWAKKTGTNQFQLMNSPFLAFGVSYLDEVIAKKSKEGALLYERVFKKSGHSTYRLMPFREVSSLTDSPLSSLEKLGCSYEEGRIGSNVLLAVDIPAKVNIHEAYHLLKQGADANLWDFEEADVGHTLA
jgi:hypothetical protein